METLTFLMTSSFYPPYHLGGDAVHVAYLAAELAKRGNEVHVLHSLDAYRAKSGIQRQAESGTIFTHRIETPFSLTAYETYVLGSSFSVTKRFRTLLKEIKPEIVHHHNISLLGYNILIRQGRYLNLYTAHDYWLICQQSNLFRNGKGSCETASCTLCGLACRRPPQLWRRSKAFWKAVRDIDVLIAPSDYLRATTTLRFPLHAVTIPNFAPNPPKQIKSSGFSDFLLYCAVLEEHKGILSLLTSFPKLAKHTGLKLVIVGEGSLYGRVREFIRRLGLEDVVFTLGWVDPGPLYALMRDASALVIPSLSPENAPLVSLQAFSVGTPVVASDRGGLPEIVSKVDRGLLFSWEQEGELIRAVGFLLRNQENLRKKAQLAYQQYFSAQAYLTSYAQLSPPRFAKQTSL